MFLTLHRYLGSLVTFREAETTWQGGGKALALSVFLLENPPR